MARLSTTSKNVTFEEAVTLAGFGKFNFLILAAAGGCLMCVIIETLSMMFIIPAAQCDLKLTLYHKGLLSSISFFGVLASSHMWGFLADTQGRKKVLIASLFLGALASFVGCFVEWIWLFIGLRFLNGFFIGGASSVCYAYMGEFHDNNHRAKIISWLTTFVAFGNMYLPGLAWLILPLDTSFEVPGINLLFKSWRLLMIIYALPSLFFAAFLYIFPESPKYLMAQGNKTDAIEVLKQMYRFNNGGSKNDYPVTSIIWDELAESPVAKNENIFIFMWKQTAPLFQKVLITKTIMVCLLQFGIFATTSGMVMWYPQIINAMSNYMNQNDGESTSICNAVAVETRRENSSNHTEMGMIDCNDTLDAIVFAVTLIMALIYMLVFIFTGAVINCFGKKRLVIAYLTIGAMAGLCAQLIDESISIQILVGLFLSSGAGIGIITAISLDLFPTQIRAMAMAISLMFGRCGAVLGSNLFGHVIYKGCDYLFFIIAGIHAVLIAIVLLLPSSPKIPDLIHQQPF